MKCHPNLIAAFTMFIINDGYSYEVGKNKVYFDKPNKQQLRINRFGEMNKSAQDRYVVFLKMWFQRGKDFIYKLVFQFNAMMGKV